jgi:hypothetical protein
MANTVSTPGLTSGAVAPFVFSLPQVQNPAYQISVFLGAGTPNSPKLSGSLAINTAVNTSCSVGWIVRPIVQESTDWGRLSDRPTVQEPTDWGRLFAKLDSLLQLQKGWDGYRAAAPNMIARNNARSFLESLSVANYSPSQVAPSVVGGIGVNRRRGKNKVYVEFNNNGKVHALFSDGTSPPRVERIQPDKIGFLVLIRRMRAYLDE